MHFIAIGGSGMNGIASMMLAQGIRVSGSDRQDSKYLRSLEAQGARVHVGHRAEQLGDASTVVASSAIRDDNPELAEARRRGLRVLHRSAALGSLMLGRRGIAVAGTHGKTTTTAMIAHVLQRLRIRPVVRHRRCAYRHGDRRSSRRRGRHGDRGGRERRLVPAVPGARSPSSPTSTPTTSATGGPRRTTPTASSALPPRDSVRLLVISADDPALSVDASGSGGRAGERRRPLDSA